MAGRGLRSSARLSGSGGSSVGSGAAARAAVVAAAAARRAAAAVAAERRARAAERAREVEDSPRVLRDKCRRLARALRNAKHLVVYTGAGISTAADIPDYRGPRGVWTRLQRGETIGRVEVSLARPTFTHMALSALWARGLLKFVVSQNCDGLHVRAGLGRRALAELHGDMFAERCAACRRVYLRAFDTTRRTARHRHGTRRLCHRCGAQLHDTIVHFGERGRAAWPLNWAGALRHAKRADVVLCLGSSLKVLRRYRGLWRMDVPAAARPRLYIVNLQWTPKDAAAELKINARCDDVMRHVARRLRLRVPRYRAAADPLLAHAEPLAPPEAHTAPPPSAALAPPPSTPSTPSTSATDSDEEVPLCSLADRLRHAHSLHAFRVELQGGAATILLRSEHAPPDVSAPPSAARRLTSELRRVRIPARRLSPDGCGGARLNGCTASAAPLANGAGERLSPSAPPAHVCTAPAALLPNGAGERLSPSAPPANGHAPASRNGAVDHRSQLRRLLECAPRLHPPLPRSPTEFNCKVERESKSDPKIEQILESRLDLISEPKIESKIEIKTEQKFELKRVKRSMLTLKPRFEPKCRRPAEEPSSGPEREALAAAIIARAVLLCRASLYPGLHTILASPPVPPPPPPPAECAWCWRQHRARRCLWYGPPRETPLHARVWRRVQRRQYLCACCGAGEGQGAPDAGAGEGEETEGGGWYGKGYRKGRRKRR